MVGVLPQEVEVAGGCGGLSHQHVVLGAHLQVALDAPRGVVRPLPLLAVGKQHDQAGALPPLLGGGGDVLVDDGLGSVGEVAELGLPHRQSLGPLH